MMLLQISVFVYLSIAKASDISYDGYKVFRVMPKVSDELKLLRYITEQIDADIWTGNENLVQPWVINLNPNVIKIFEKWLNQTNMDYDIINTNLGNTISNEKRINSDHSEKKNFKKFYGEVDSIDTITEKLQIKMDQYYTYEEMTLYMEAIVQILPEQAELITLGTTVENRLVEGVKLSNGDGGSKPAILIEAGTHAREWITPALALYVMSQLIGNESYNFMLEKVDWYIFPVLNPDGYSFSMTQDRMWRKNRAKNIKCYGIDLNRNYDFQWNDKEAEECGDIYPGPHPFSEPETYGLAGFAWQYRNDIKLFLSLHSYGPYIFYPWAWSNQKAQTEKELHDLGQKAAKAIENVRGTKYAVGSVANLLYTAYGSSQDWMYGAAGIPLAFTFEVASNGKGFDPPQDMISSIVEETFEGIKVLHNYIEEIWG